MPTTTLFADLPLHGDVQRAIARMRFRVPSPIQLHALPLALFGNDVIGQAKSGTGKTAVFGVAAVEHAISKCQKQHQESHSGVFGVNPIDPLALILAPTREIALQIDAVVRDIARFRPACVIQTFIGGLPIAQDREKLKQNCHIAIGTPGRVKALVEQRILHCHMLRLLVLDEVDKLIQSDFENETLAFSATFTTDQLATVAQMMQSPQIVRVRGPDDVSVELVSSSLEDLSAWKQREEANENPELWLRYVQQFYSIVPSQSDSSDNPVGREANDALGMRAKIVKLTALLSEVVFNQCIVFCNDKFRAEALATALESQGWPAACITGSQSQATRSDVMHRFRSFHTRVLVSTDLTARGIDVDKVNFVVNLDLPRDPATFCLNVCTASQ
uniref:RNA helicase n=1 Tax=Globisporangium ultimum (strain ATCC 200006 / CBS 805.95 / DAOM BR144) TaxID=431595 RepID=K3X413_GLOUD